MDANMEPEEFKQCFWVMQTAGLVVAPSAPLGTCRQRTARGLSTSTIDFFMLDPRLASRVQKVEVWEQYLSAPHKP
eukprot:1629758-Lingulodinium_polyedra.AAC.1